jgi:hypothetical protein
MLAKCARIQHAESDLFIVSLHFVEELESNKTDFDPELHTHVQELETKFADVTQELQGLPPHRVETFDHKSRLTAHPKCQRRNR